MIIGLEQCKDSDCQHIVQQMPLPCQNHIVHCRNKIHDSSAFLVYTVLERRPMNGCLFVF